MILRNPSRRLRGLAHACAFAPGENSPFLQLWIADLVVPDTNIQCGIAHCRIRQKFIGSTF
eukprot:5171067-Amphidinium_carterae.1